MSGRVGEAARRTDAFAPDARSGASAVSPPADLAPALPLALTLAMLAFTYWCVDTVSPTLPVMRDDLRLSATGAGLVVSFFFGGRLVANLPAAMLVGRSGPRWTAAIGALTLLVGSVVVAVAHGDATLLPARALQGAGVALLATAGLLSVLRALPGGGAAMTAFNVAAGVGSSGGLLAGGLLTSSLGWRAVFWSSAGIAAFLFVGALAARPVVGERRATPHAVPTTTTARAGKVSTTVACVANLLVYGNYAIWVVGLPLYANGRFGATAEQIGVLLMVINAIHLVAAFPALRVIRLAGAPVALGFGFTATAIGLALTLATPTAGWLWAPMAIYAVGQIAGNSAAGDLILRLGGGGGRAVSLVRFSSDLGLVVGPAAVGWLADAAGYGAPFVALAAASAAAALAVLALRTRGWLRAG